VSFGDDVDLSLREKTVVEHIVLARHCLLCSSFCLVSRLLVSCFCRWSVIRKSLATKKATAVTLSKRQQALMQTRLEKEAKIRQHVQDICANLTRGLHLVRGVVTAGVDEFHSYMTSVLSLLLNGALSRGSFLVGTIAFETYLVNSFLDTFFQTFFNQVKMTRTMKMRRRTMKVIVMTMTRKVGTKPMRMRTRERTTMVMPVPDLLLVDYLWSAHWFFADENENKFSLHPI
jgi:hypothetical protein